MKILVAYNGSPASEAALDEIARRPWPAGSEVRLVTVVELPTQLLSPSGAELYVPVMESVRVSLREDAQRRMQQAIQRLKGRADLEVSSEIRDAGTKQALLEAIKKWRPDLVVVGSQGTTLLGRMFLGSVALALATHAPCSVEIVRTPNAGGPA